ncbi:MAG: hypothetical protein JXD19_01710 [Deltaproteobacteria bacterium]|nr:hypothetical protein [Deltaproteobacteria bacterium]
MAAIIVLEMRGFADLASQLARDLDIIGASPARVRAAMIQIVTDTIALCKQKSPFMKMLHLGGDSWYFTFEDIEPAIRFACLFLTRIIRLVNENGLFYLKPSLALNIGEPTFDGERFLDDISIKTYRAADSGYPFRLCVLGKAIDYASKINWVQFKPTPDSQPKELQCIDWQNSSPPIDNDAADFPMRLPTLLLDSEVIYSDSTNEAVANIIRQQERAQSVFAFGGPVPYDSPIYRNYIRSTIAVLKNNPACKWTVLSYLPQNDPLYTYTWLELCRRFSLMFSDRYAFACLIVPEGQLIPFSYHIYDETTVHIGLRSFSPQRGTPSMSSAIVFRNSRIASHFKEEFLEKWRQVGPLSPDAFTDIFQKLKDITPEIKKSALDAVDEMFED